VKRLAGVVACALAFWPAPGWPHEERLMVGQVEVVEPPRRLLVVNDTQRGERRRLEVNQETEVLACGRADGLAALRPGELVRVKYLDRPGAGPEATSILRLRPPR
jgi:hypothetical protein